MYEHTNRLLRIGKSFRFSLPLSLIFTALPGPAFAWQALGSGISADVYALTTDASGNLVVGGSFSFAGGNSVSNIAKWDGSTWSTLNVGMNNVVFALTTDTSGNPVAGGAFTTAGGNPASNIAKWNGSAWSALGSGIVGGINALTKDGSGNLMLEAASTQLAATVPPVSPNGMAVPGRRWALG